MRHWAVWIEGTDELASPLVLPGGLSYTDAQQIVRDQAGANPAPEETAWILGSIWENGMNVPRIRDALPVWRLHVPPSEAAGTIVD